MKSMAMGIFTLLAVETNFVGGAASGVVEAKGGPVSHSDWVHPPVTFLNGTLLEIDTEKKQITVCVARADGEESVVVCLGVETVITIAGKSALIINLRSGMSVKVKRRSGDVLEITAATP